MRIAIDARAYSWTGIGRYTRNIVRELVSMPTPHHFIVLLTKKDYPKFKAEYQEATHVTTHIVEESYYSWQEQTIFWRQLESIHADLFHFTHFNLPVFFSKPYVVTIHDTTRFIFSGQRQQGLVQQLAYEWVFKRAVERSKGVVCVSQATVDELHTLPLYIPSRVQVIHEGVDDFLAHNISFRHRKDVRDFLKITNPYLLCVGVWMSHKNIERLIQAFKLVLSKHTNLKLVITGKPQKGYVDVPAVATKYGVQHAVVFPGFVEPHILPALYAEATAFVFPSLYEGFGLPPLEAAACGTPVVCSNVSSVPEVMGTAALYINPDSTQDIVRGLQMVLSDHELLRNLQVEGRKRAAEFTWEKAAKQTLHMYEECATVIPT